MGISYIKLFFQVVFLLVCLSSGKKGTLNYQYIVSTAAWTSRNSNYFVHFPLGEETVLSLMLPSSDKVSKPRSEGRITCVHNS